MTVGKMALIPFAFSTALETPFARERTDLLLITKWTNTDRFFSREWRIKNKVFHFLPLFAGGSNMVATTPEALNLLPFDVSREDRICFRRNCPLVRALQIRIVSRGLGQNLLVTWSGHHLIFNRTLPLLHESVEVSV